MDPKMLITVFVTIFLAELGDKTQVAILLFASDTYANKFGVFVAAAAALVFSTLIGVFIGGTVSCFLNRRVLSIIAGLAFVVIGAWYVIQGINSAA